MKRTLPTTFLAALVGFSLAFALTGCPSGDLCGDGKKSETEECDDGNRNDTDSCRNDCTVLAHCGDGKKEGAEACDDGNIIPGDGCEADCTLQATTCGDAVVEGYEACDDGNQEDNDGCQKDCTFTPPSCGNGTREPAEECDDGNDVPKDGCETNCTLTPKAVCGDGKREGAEACDDGNQDPNDACQNDCTLTQTQVEICPAADLPAPASGTCTVTSGDASRLFTGVVLTPGKVLKGGQVLVDAKGVIQCAACDCSAAAGAATATKVTCPKGVVSPGLINLHDHITFQAEPFVFTDGGTERYEHRHDWRNGQDGHSKISNGGSASSEQIRWAELRQVMSGTTSVVGAGGQKGFLRNLDNRSAPQPDGGTAASQENLGASLNGANAETFPLGDSSGTERTADCNYTIDPASKVIPADSAYLPHVAEGIEASARNEFVCLSPIGTGKARDHQGSRTAMVHGIGLRASDISLAVNQGTGLIWSPRSNISLYGDTAAVQTYARLGATVALGTDWVRSGSMNMLRELKCADYLNASFYNHAFSDDGLWRMATVNAAKLGQVAAKVGTLEAGKVADLAIYRLGANTPYRAVIAANPEDVVLTVRGGKVLYGDAAVVSALSGGESCDALNVCGAPKSACVMSEIGISLAALQTQNASTYPLFFCNAPPANEPSCTPTRVAPWSVNGSSTYTGMPAANDKDADGIPDAMDNCPSVFNPIRPMDDGKQADFDGDGQGDLCDLCPLGSADRCVRATPVDTDADGIKNLDDNCPGDFNPNQADADGDKRGDVCDACPSANPGTMACATSIYEAKREGSKLIGLKVTLDNALVTAVAPTGLFVQVDPADPAYAGPDNSALYVFVSNSGAKVGDKVNVAGTLANYFGQIQLSSATATVVSSGHPLPPPVVVTPAEVAKGGSRARALEGALVTLSNLTVTNLNPTVGSGDRAPTNEFEVGSGLRVNDLMFLLTPAAELNENIASLTGVLELRNDNYKIEPRSSADFAFSTTTLTELSPAQVFTRVGMAGPTLPEPLTVKLKRPLGADAVVTLSSANGMATVPTMLTLPKGEVRASVPVTGVNVSSSVALTASYGGKTLTATVRVLGAMESGALTSLTSSPTGAPAGGKVSVTVRFDAPVLADTEVALALTPATFGTAPATVTVKANQLSSTFDVSFAATATGSATLTATVGAANVSATLNVAQPQGNVVISELAVAGPGVAGQVGAADEFVELYNPTAAPVNVGGWKLQYKSAKGATFSDVVALPMGTTVPAGGYLLIASDKAYSDVMRVTPDVTWVTNSGSAGVFGGTSGHLRLGNASVGTAKVDPNAVDTLAYGADADSAEGGSTFATAIPTGGSIERKAKATSTQATMAGGGADEKAGNGYDTNNNANDFVVRAAREPQNKTVTEP